MGIRSAHPLFSKSEETAYLSICGGQWHVLHLLSGPASDPAQALAGRSGSRKHLVHSDAISMLPEPCYWTQLECVHFLESSADCL